MIAAIAIPLWTLLALIGALALVYGAILLWLWATVQSTDRLIDALIATMTPERRRGDRDREADHDCDCCHPPLPPDGIQILQLTGVAGYVNYNNGRHNYLIKELCLMPINGITLGSTGTFGETPTPAGTQFPAGTTFTWTTSDPLTTLTPSADGTTVAVATSAADTATSFNLTCTASTGQSGSAVVPLLPPTAPTGIAINQLS